MGAAQARRRRDVAQAFRPAFGGYDGEMRGLLVIAVLVIPAPCLAQFYAHPLFVEAARDPGRAEQLTSPFALATGGQMSAGSPEAAMFASSTLMVARDTRAALQYSGAHRRLPGLGLW